MSIKPSHMKGNHNLNPAKEGLEPKVEAAQRDWQGHRWKTQKQKKVLPLSGLPWERSQVIGAPPHPTHQPLLSPRRGIHAQVWEGPSLRDRTAWEAENTQEEQNTQKLMVQLSQQQLLPSPIIRWWKLAVNRHTAPLRDRLRGNCKHKAECVSKYD